MAIPRNFGGIWVAGWQFPTIHGIKIGNNLEHYNFVEMN